MGHVFKFAIDPAESRRRKFPGNAVFNVFLTLTTRFDSLLCWALGDPVYLQRSAAAGIGGLLLISILWLPPLSSHAAADPAEKMMLEAQHAFTRGAFAQAAAAWRDASTAYAEENQPAQQIQALLYLAEAYQALGQQHNALQTLEQAQTLAETAGDKTTMAAILGSLGKLSMLTGASEHAENYLQTSIELARDADVPSIEGASLNNLGSVLSDRGNYAEANRIFKKALQLAQQTEDPLLIVKTSLNLAEAALAQRNYADTETWLARASKRIQVLTPSHEKAYGLIAIGKLYQQLLKANGAHKDKHTLKAHQAFNQAAEIGDELGDPRTQSYAAGYLGQLYKEQQRLDEALILSHRAVFAAQQAHAPEILYRWQWQVGQLLKTQGNVRGATAAYQEAVDTLQTIRQDLSLGYRGVGSFREAIGPLFFELADLLLQQASIIEDPKQAQDYLREARSTTEQLKVFELQDYFQDECVLALQSRVTPLDQLAADTAVIYPILLADRTELLLSLATGIKRFTVPVTRQALTQEVRALRQLLEKRATREYRLPAQQLYSWLIEPLEAELNANRINTLVFVPDGPLRTIPMASLHDGNAYLIERYALATTPGLTLTDYRPIERDDIQVLVNGITESVQGYPPLEYASLELASVQQLYDSTLLKNQEFLIPRFRSKLTQVPYSIVHIASHGEFTADADDSFVLAFDGKLTMDRLEEFMSLSQYRRQPVELLTLSACQSAAGDDRAALGLAGVAVKAGARSALATLWFINDEASSALVSEFYKQLQNSTLSKAEALKQAQLTLLADRRYRHPAYWAPFLLIGNWL